MVARDDFGQCYKNQFRIPHVWNHAESEAGDLDASTSLYVAAPYAVGSRNNNLFHANFIFQRKLLILRIFVAA